MAVQKERANESFETALKQLEKITEDLESLESGKISLESSLKKFEEGVELVTYCSRELSDAKAKVEMLLKKTNGLEAVPFDGAMLAQEDGGDYGD